jgi:hypothetical protein
MHGQQPDLFAGHDDDADAVDARLVKRASQENSFGLARNQRHSPEKQKIFSRETKQRLLSRLKNCLASWLLSADTTTNARRSKAIGGRFDDDGVGVTRSPVRKCRAHRLKSLRRVRLCAVAQIFRDRRVSERATPSREFIPLPMKKFRLGRIPAGKLSASAASQVSDQRYRLIGEAHG